MTLFNKFNYMKNMPYSIMKIIEETKASGFGMFKGFYMYQMNSYFTQFAEYATAYNYDFISKYSVQILFVVTKSR